MPVNSKKSKQSRFPVARIKRIMQLDEEVGKLASATPVMISKSLECFLQVLLDETVKETRARGSKKLTAYHLKQMINTNETFDFLRGVVETIPDPAAAEPKAGPSKRKVSDNLASNPSGSYADPNAPPVAGPKKRGRKPAGLKTEQREGQAGEAEAAVPTPTGALPSIGTWKRDMTGGGGTGEGGRGIFDDYEDDDDY